MRGAFLVTNYNKQDTIAESIKSMLQQEYSDINKDAAQMDILVVDDGSTDHSADILKYLEKKYTNIKVKYGTTNKGIGIRRNQLLTEAIKQNYDFIIVGDSDDMFTSAIVNNTLNVLREGADVVYCSYHHVDYLYDPIRDGQVEIEAPEESEIKFKEGKQNVSHVGLCVTNRFFHIGYPEAKYGEDFEYLYKLMDAGAKFKKIRTVWDKTGKMILNAGYCYVRSANGVSIKHKAEIEKRDKEFLESKFSK